MATTLKRMALVTALAAGTFLFTGTGSAALASSLPMPTYTLSNAGPKDCTIEASNAGEFVPALEIGLSGLGTGSHAVAAWTDDDGYVAATIEGNSGKVILGSHAGTVTITEVVEYTDASLTTVLSFLTGPASIVLSSCSGTQGSMGPYVGISSTSDGLGYWIASGGGFVFNYGDAPFWGSFPYLASPPGAPRYLPVIGISGTHDGRGYWMAGYDGSLFAYGDAHFYGSMGGTHLNKPIVGMASTPDGKGYWMVASDGGIFAFGDAAFHGSMGGTHLNQPIVGMTSTPDGKGYWLVASDGGIFAFGDAAFHGSMGGTHLNQPIVGMAAASNGGGYWMVASDGGVFALGAAPFEGAP